MRLRFAPLTGVAVLLLLAMAVMTGLSGIGSWDIWWHLKTGELAWIRGSTLPFDEFSLTHQGDPWIYKDLGADILLYHLHNLWGENGLIAFKLGASVLVLALVLAVVHRRVKTWGWVVLFTGLAFSIASFRIIVRPEAFSLVFLPCLLLLIDRYRSQRSVKLRDKWPLVASVILLWVWCNCHRGAVLGLVVLWGYAGFELVAGLCARYGFRPFWLRFTHCANSNKPVLGGLTVVAFACAAVGAMFLNPSGVTLFEQAFAVTSSEGLETFISEWNRLSLAQLWQDFPLTVVWVAAALVLVPAAFYFRVDETRNVDLWDQGVVMFFVVVAIQTPRLHPFLAIATAPSLAAACDVLWKRLRLRMAALNRVQRAFPVVAAGLVWLVVFATERAQFPNPGWSEDRYPEAAVAMIGSGEVLGEGATTYTFAGYVIYHLWPQQHVLCDGRYDTVYPDETIRLCLSLPNDPALFQFWVSQYQLEWVLTHNRPGSPRNPHAPSSFDFLDVDSNWALIYWDEASLLYVRTDGPNHRIASEQPYRFLRPHDPDMSLMEALYRTRDNPAQRAFLEAELYRLFNAAPEDYRVIILVALWLFETGQTETAEFGTMVHILETLRETDPAAIDQVLRYLNQSQ